MARYAVTEQEDDPGSALNLYRQALRLRRHLLAGEHLEWRDTGRPDVLRFARHQGWEVVANFGTTEVPLDGGEVLLSSGPLRHDAVPAETTVWIAPRG
jgi:alpha-glucosidase